MQRCFPDQQYNKDLNEELPARLNKNNYNVDLVGNDEESEEKVELSKDGDNLCVDDNIGKTSDDKGKDESEEEEMTRGERDSKYEENGERKGEEKWKSEKEKARESEMDGEQEYQIQQNDIQPEFVDKVLLACDCIHI